MVANLAQGQNEHTCLCLFVLHGSGALDSFLCIHIALSYIMANLDHQEQVEELEHIDTMTGLASSDTLPGTWEYEITNLQTNTEK